MQNAPGVTYIMKEMVKHLGNLLFVNGVFTFLVRKRTKSKSGEHTLLIYSTQQPLSEALVKLGKLVTDNVYI